MYTNTCLDSKIGFFYFHYFDNDWIILISVYYIYTWK